MRAGWNVDKEKIIAALHEVIDSRDPETMLEAAKLLMLADSIDVKREELEEKKKVKQDAQRLRLLELARLVPVDELARIASENGIAGPAGRIGGREGSPTSIDASEASSPTRHPDTDSR